MRAVADYVDSDGPLPGALRDGWRMERFGAPFAGGWLSWPLRWVRRVEMALNVYGALTTVGRAMSMYENDTNALAKWQRENQRLVDAVAEIQRMRDEAGSGDE